MLEKAAKAQKEGKTPTLPIWLAPTQIRILPVSNEYLQSCEKLLEKMEKTQIRIDLDDRDETLGKRIREAEKEWIPYIIVIGDKEVKSNKLSVRDRYSGNIREIETSELIKEINDASMDKPFRPLNMVKYISKRPQIAV